MPSKHAVALILLALSGAIGLAPVPAGAVTLSCLGDSVTTGAPYDVIDPTKPYPAALQAGLDADYGPGVFQVRNHGVPVQSTAGLYASLQTEDWLDEDPDAVFLMIGVYDLDVLTDAQEYIDAAEAAVVNVQQSVNFIRAHTNANGVAPRVLVGAIPPNNISNLANWAVDYYNSRLASQLTGLEAFFYDNHDDLYDGDTLQADASLMYDATHPNAAGLALIAENWRQQMDLLAQPLLIPGDANGSGRVDVGDLGILAFHYGLSDKLWNAGDFTGDGTVDSSDVEVLAAYYGGAPASGALGARGAGPAAVPEPCMLGLLLAASLASLRRRPMAGPRPGPGGSPRGRCRQVPCTSPRPAGPRRNPSCDNGRWRG